MRINTFEDKDAQVLLDSLELEKLRMRGDEQLTTDEMHRRMHYRVVLWLQAQGWKR